MVVVHNCSVFKDISIIVDHTADINMTYSDIAQVHGISVKTVEWRMSKALGHCLMRLDD